MSFSAFVSQEKPKIIFQFTFWALSALPIIAAIHYGWINNKTNIPDGVVHFIEEKISLYVLGYEIFLLIVLSGIAAIIKQNKMIEHARDEIARLFYNFGSTFGWLLVTLFVLEGKPYNLISALLSWAAFYAAGFFFYYHTSDNT